jgi:hypothetical protein
MGAPRLGQKLRPDGKIARHRVLCRRRIHQAVIAALDASVVLVTWDQQDNTRIAVQIRAPPTTHLLNISRPDTKVSL